MGVDISETVVNALVAAAVAKVVSDKQSPSGQGMKGDKGDKGDKGEKGDKGDSGVAGPQGDPGAPAGPAQMFSGHLFGARGFHVPANVTGNSGGLSFPAGGVRAYGVTAPLDRECGSVLVGLVADKAVTVQLRERSSTGAVGAVIVERAGVPNNGFYHDLECTIEPGKRYFVVVKSAEAMSIASSFVTRPEATSNLFVVPSDNLASADDGATWYIDSGATTPRIYFS